MNILRAFEFKTTATDTCGATRRVQHGGNVLLDLLQALVRMNGLEHFLEHQHNVIADSIALRSNDAVLERLNQPPAAGRKCHATPKHATRRRGHTKQAAVSKRMAARMKSSGGIASRTPHAARKHVHSHTLPDAELPADLRQTARVSGTRQRAQPRQPPGAQDT